MKEKTEDWRREYTKYKTLLRNKDLPRYFSSQFCKTYHKT
nr:unnamed protein product [Callosobruchus analis]